MGEGNTGGLLKAFNIGALLLVFVFAVAIYNFPELPSLQEAPENDSAIAALDLRRATPQQLEILALNDGAPLFFYTNYNYGNVEFDLPGLTPIDLSVQEASTYDALSHFEESILRSVDFSTPKLISPESTIYALFAKDGRHISKLANVKEVSAVKNYSCRVLDFESGKLVYSQDVPIGVDTGSFLWSPVEMTLIVNLDGSPSAPFTTSQSGIEALDRAFEDFVLKNSAGFRLKPGFYKLIFSH